MYVNIIYSLTYTEAESFLTFCCTLEPNSSCLCSMPSEIHLTFSIYGISHLACMWCCSFTPNRTSRKPTLKQVGSSFVTGPRGNEQGELDVLSNYGKDKKPVRVPRQGPPAAPERRKAFTHKSERGSGSAANYRKQERKRIKPRKNSNRANGFMHVKETDQHPPPWAASSSWSSWPWQYARSALTLVLQGAIMIDQHAPEAARMLGCLHFKSVGLFVSWWSRWSYAELSRPHSTICCILTLGLAPGMTWVKVHTNQLFWDSVHIYWTSFSFPFRFCGCRGAGLQG